MAARAISKEELGAAVKEYAARHELTVSTNEKGFALMPGDIIVTLTDGKPFCSDTAILDSLIEILMDMAEEPASAPQKPNLPARSMNTRTNGRSSNGGPLVRSDMPVRDIQVTELTFDDIRQYLCPAANDKDTMMFLKLCQARNLNPFTGEAFLVPFKDNKSQEIKCAIIVGKEAFMRKAEVNPHYRGFKAGIIVSKDGGELIYREGTFLRHGEVLEGGWSEVYRDDRDYPIRSEDSLKEYDSGKGLWANGKKETMMRKVSVVKSHREAFPSDLAGCYDRTEMDQSIDAEYEVGA